MVAIGSLETPCQVLSRWNGQERETSVPIARYDPEVEANERSGDRQMPHKAHAIINS